MEVHIFDAHVHRVRDDVRLRGGLSEADHDDRAVAEDELSAVVSDAETLGEPEGVAEPVSRLGRVGIGEDGNDR
jgi:hypothetical protein